MATSDPAEWVELYGDDLFGYARSRVGDVQTAEDLVQETLIGGLRGMSEFQSRSSIKTWLFSIMKNKIIDYYRSKSRTLQDHPEDQEQFDTLFNEKGMWRESVQGWQRTPEDALGSREFQSILKKCVSKLSDLQRQVFSYRDIDGLEGDDICKVLDISSSNLWVLTHRARHRIRECLTKNWFGGE